MIYIENKNQTNEIRFPKSLSNGAPAAYLYLENHLGNYTMSVVDTSNYSNYYVFSLNLSNVQDGEYYAYLQDVAKNVLAQTIMYVGVSDEDEIDYEYYEEPEIDIEFDPDLITINPYDVEVIDKNNNVNYYHFGDGIVPNEYFTDNEEIVSVRFGNAITTIGEYAFAGCSLLQRIEWGNVSTLGDYAFGWLTNMETLHIPSTITNFGESIFELSSIKNVIIEEGCNISGATALLSDNYELTSVSIPTSTTVIPDFFCNYCDKLTTVYLHSGITKIGIDSFAYCSSLNSIICDATTAPELDYESFKNVAEVGILTVPNGADYSSWYAALPIGWNPNVKTMLLHFQDGTTETIKTLNPVIDDTYSDDETLVAVEIGEGFTTLDDYAFENCPNLTSVTLPNSLTSIGEDAFYECSGLSSINIPNSVTEISDYAFYDCSSLSSINIPTGLTSINKGVFSGCESLTSVTIPDNVTIIKQGAFYGCFNIQLLYISKNSKLTQIDHLAFLGNELIENLKLPTGITYIGQWAFSYCYALTSITCSATTAPTLDEGAFADIAEVGTLTYPSGSDYSTFYDALPEGWRPAPEPSQYQVTLYLTGGTVQTDSFPTSVIPKYTYNKRTDIVSVVIGSGITEIDSVRAEPSGGGVTFQRGTFCGCTNLTSVTFPNTLTTIGKGCFENCTNLSSVNFSTGLTTIDDFAFSNCSSLSSLTLPNTLTTIGENAFDNCTNISGTLTIPDNVTAIGGSSFYNCDGITSLVFGQNSHCTSIGNGAFESCYNLTNVYLPASLQSVGNSAFAMCSELINITCSATTAPTLGDSVFYGASTASLDRGTLTYPSGSDYSTWYAQLPEKFNPNPNPGGGGDGEDDAG